MREWLEGSVNMDKTPEAKSNFEKQVEDLAEKVTDQNGLLQMLIQKLDEQSKVMEQQQRYIEDSLKMRDRHLTEHLRSQFEVAVAVEAPKRTGRGKPGFFFNACSKPGRKPMRRNFTYNKIRMPAVQKRAGVIRSISG